MLARRLAARGVALSAGAAVLSQNMASAAVPVSALSSTIKAASRCAAGQAATSVKVAVLAEGVLKAMLISKLKAAVAVVLVLGLMAIGATGFGIARGQPKIEVPQESEKAQKGKMVKEKAEAIAWGKEVDGLQMGLALMPEDTHTVRQGKKAKFAIKLRNVGKAEVSVTYGMLRDCAPQITTDTGGPVSVYMPPPSYVIYGPPLPPTKRALKPGETITLYNPEVAVEPEDRRAKVLGEMWLDTPTICVAPGKYKIAFGGMIQSHPTLTTGTVEFEVKEPAKPVAKDHVAWGEEADGLQAGIVGPGSVRIGEKARFAVKLRNVGKADIKVTYVRLRERPPTVTDAGGGRVKVAMPPSPRYYAPTIERVLKPGETIALYDPEVAVQPEDPKMDGEVRVETPTIFAKPGKYKIAYGGMLTSHPKLTTDTVEVEVKPAKPVEAFTAWGKEIGGLQAGLTISEKRAYTHGETVTLILRVRNNGKEAVEFKHIWAFFVENPPTITDADGKRVELPKFIAEGLHGPRNPSVAPGEEVDLYDWTISLQPKGEKSKNVFTIHGTGKFSLQCERIVGPTSANPNHPNPALTKLATGKLELEVNEQK